MAKGIKKQLHKVIENINNEISGLAQGGLYAAGLSSEGYSGGYRDAICDVILALNGVKPNRRDYWEAR